MCACFVAGQSRQASGLLQRSLRRPLVTSLQVTPAGNERGCPVCVQSVAVGPCHSVNCIGWRRRDASSSNLLSLYIHRCLHRTVAWYHSSRRTARALYSRLNSRFNDARRRRWSSVVDPVSRRWLLSLMVAKPPQPQSRGFTQWCCPTFCLFVRLSVA